MPVVQSAFTLVRLGMGAGKGAGAVLGLFAVAGLAHQEEGADDVDLDAGLHAAEKGLAGISAPFAAVDREVALRAGVWRPQPRSRAGFPGFWPDSWDFSQNPRILAGFLGFWPALLGARTAPWERGRRAWERERRSWERGRRSWERGLEGRERGRRSWDSVVYAESADGAPGSAGWKGGSADGAPGSAVWTNQPELARISHTFA